MRASYTFRVTFRLDPSAGRVDPASFETVYRRSAPEPDEAEGWRFFQEWLWHGDLNDPDQFRPIVESELGVEVTAIRFSELETDREYRTALEEAIEANLEAFNAESAGDVIHAHLGSSIRVIE
ncbi:MAG: LWR-salt protein [Halobacteriota archaeon]